MDKISVVIPVYNAEKYLNKCIDSVINQTYNNIEIILVNDGSKDNSLKILEQYRKKYPKVIKVFTQENQGAGAARNFGIKHITGKYIFFLDSDDWIEVDYLYKLHKDIGKNDIVISGLKNYSSDGKIFVTKVEDNPWTKFKYCSMGGKMYLADLIVKNNIFFKKFKICEDAYFLLECYSRTNKITISNSSGYCHLENPNSITHTLSGNDHNSIIDVLKKVNTEIDCSNFEQRLLSFFYMKSIVLDTLISINDFSERKLVQKFKNNMLWYLEVLKKMKLRFKIYNQKGETLKINFIVNIFVIAYKLNLIYLIIFLLKKGKVKIR